MEYGEAKWVSIEDRRSSEGRILGSTFEASQKVAARIVTQHRSRANVEIQHAQSMKDVICRRMTERDREIRERVSTEKFRNPDTF